MKRAKKAGSYRTTMGKKVRATPVVRKKKKAGGRKRF